MAVSIIAQQIWDIVNQQKLSLVFETLECTPDYFWAILVKVIYP